MKIKELMPLMQMHGRTIYDDKKEALFCNWTCSGFTIGVDGSYLKVKVEAIYDLMPPMPNFPPSPPDWPCIGVVVDGELTGRTECRNEEAQWVTLWEGTEKKRQEIRFVKISENSKGKLGVVELETDGTFFKAEEKKLKKIEIIGDSITCGFGNEAPNNSMEFKTMEENGWTSYGAMAARELGYEFSIISESGICAIRPKYPLFDQHAMDEVYPYTDELYDKRREAELTAWDFKANPQDIVVINLGTNDGNAIRFYKEFDTIEENEKWFHEGYKKFVKMVREYNGPDTFILCGLGSMDYYLYYHIKEVVDELRKEDGDEKIFAFEFVPINVMFEQYGAGGHPSQKTHNRMAKELIRYIEKFAG